MVERWLTRRYINPALAAEAARWTVSDHYFTARPETGHRPGQVHVLLPDVHLELATDAGVFSPGRIDPGTRLLLDVAADPTADPATGDPGPGDQDAGQPGGDLLDLGAGYGPIALVLARRAPAATVWAVDVNERALDLCTRNAATAGLSNVRCVHARGPGPARELHEHVVEPADPDRQAGAARPAGRVAAPAGARRRRYPPWSSATWARTRCTAG